MKRIGELLIWSTVTSALILTAADCIYGQEDSTDAAVDDTTQIVIDGTLHSFSEVFAIVDRSATVYELSMFDPDSMPVDTSDPEIINGGLYIDSLGALQSLVISDTAEVMLAMGDGAFEAKDYTAARNYYREAAKLDPQFHLLITWIGDTFYNEGEYDSAAYYFEQAQEVNRIDYDAAWFLADTYWHLGDTARALRTYTRAHLLNINHESLNAKMKDVRDLAGRPWQEWSFDPQYQVSEDSSSVSVRMAGTKWFGYAVVKAVWEYEPGYREKMTADCTTSFDALLREEKEALVAYISSQEKDERISQIIDEGYTVAFICYEILAKRNPSLMLVINPEGFEHIMDYVLRYH